MKITKGKQKQPIRALLYGTEGVGKTTLVANLPNVLLLDTERGSLRADCSRSIIKDWAALAAACRELETDAKKQREWETIVIDSITAAERMLIDEMCKKANKKSLASWAYGEGYAMFEKRFDAFLRFADNLVDAGYNVLFVGHSVVKRADDPVDGSWDRFEVDLDKRSAAMIKRWADVVAFMRFKQAIKTREGEKPKGVGGKERVIYTARTAAYDAKSRLSMPDEIGGDLKVFTEYYEDTENYWGGIEANRKENK